MAQKVFIKNAMVLTATSLILRGLGLAFRVYIAGILGSEGMGLYQLVFSVYLLASTFASAGITMAVTRVISEQLTSLGRRGIIKIANLSIAGSIVMGLATAAILWFISPFVGGTIVDDARVIPALQVLSISLPFVAANAALRGFFMAQREVSLTSRSQIFEQLVKFAVVFLLVWQFDNFTMQEACIFVMVGDTLSEVGDFLYQGIGYLKVRNRIPVQGNPPLPMAKVGKKMLQIALPVAGVRYVNSILYTIENVLVPALMAMFFASRSIALSQWGELKGMAIPLLTFPSSFLAGFSMLLVPELTQCCALGQKERMQSMSMVAVHISAILSAFGAICFALLYKEIGVLFYKDAGVGFYLLILAPIVPSIYIENVVDNLLKGLNQQVSTLQYSIVNSIVRIGLILPIVPKWGMQGFLFVMIVSNIITSYLNVHRLITVLHIKTPWVKWVVCPAAAAVAAWIAGGTVQMAMLRAGMGELAVICGVGLAAAAVFVAVLYVTKNISRDEIAILTAPKKKENKSHNAI